MKRYGVREICEVTFRATAPMELGGKRFFKGEPVLFFNSLKTSSLEGAATTVYATGGRGNSRLMSWDGEKTLTFTMEDALITTDSLALLAAAKGKKMSGEVHTQKRLGVINSIDSTATEAKESYVYVKDKDTTEGNKVTISLDEKDILENVGDDGLVYVLAADEGGFNSEPFLFKAKVVYTELTTEPKDWKENYKNYYSDNTGTAVTGDTAPTFASNTYFKKGMKLIACEVDPKNTKDVAEPTGYTAEDLALLTKAEAIYLDYYTTGHGFTRLTIEPDSFGSNFYIEAETLFRDDSGADYAAIFTIPNCRVQSNFTITMASSGDPSEKVMRLAA